MWLLGALSAHVLDVLLRWRRPVGHPRFKD
jgi:hypothetical protein